MVLYTDFTVRPIGSFPSKGLLRSKKCVFDTKTISALKEVGFVAGKAACQNDYENGFHMLSNAKPHMLTALEIALIEPGSSLARNPYVTPRFLGGCIHSYFTNIMDVFYYLDQGKTIHRKQDNKDSFLEVGKEKEQIANFLRTTFPLKKSIKNLPLKNVNLPMTTFAYERENENKP